MLEWIKILEWLNNYELQNLEVFCQERYVKSWEIIFNEGDDANSMYLISKWEIEVFTTKNNEEIILWNIKSENIMWEMAIFWEKEKRMASARAVKDSVIIILLEFSIHELTQNHSEILEKIKEIIEKRKNENKNLI